MPTSRRCHFDLSRARFRDLQSATLSRVNKAKTLEAFLLDLQNIVLYCALLFANILGLTIWIERKFFLRDTGRKLRHLDQEIHTGQSELSDEILSRFGEEEEQ